MMDPTLHIDLAQPVTLGQQTYAALDLREPTAGELMKFEQTLTKDGAVAGLILLIALIAGIPRPAVEKISVTDYRQAEAYLAGFIVPPRAVGGPLLPN